MTLDKIDLQSKARPQRGRIEFYWFENPGIDLARTRFHRIVVPLGSLDSGLDWVPQPEQPELTIEWINLTIDDPSELDGVTLSEGQPDKLEASVYIGQSHNWVSLDELRLTRKNDGFLITCRCTVDFEAEGVGQSEPFEFEVEAGFVGEAAE